MDNHTPEMQPVTGILLTDYKFLINRLNAGDETDATRMRLLMKADDLLERLEVPPLLRSQVLEDIFPKLYEETGLTFDEWKNSVRLVPVRMLLRGHPSADTVTADYVQTMLEATFYKATITPDCADECIRQLESCCLVSVVNEALRQLRRDLFFHISSSSNDTSSGASFDRYVGVIAEIGDLQTNKYQLLSKEKFEEESVVLQHEVELFWQQLAGLAEEDRGE